MRARILDFAERLRARDLPVSVAETMDAIAAVAAAGVERPVLREALAATLVKDERDRTVFDEAFDEAFPLVGASPIRPRKRGVPAGGAAAEARGTGAGAAGAARGRPRQPDDEPAPGVARRATRDAPDRGEHAALRRMRAARERELLRRPFPELTSADVDEARALVHELGRRLRTRLARRERRRRRGRLDVRRMLRAAIGTGGVPVVRFHRGRRPHRPDLVALVDVSGSVATASELCLGLLAPAASAFRRVHTFAYVDGLCPVTIERSHLVPDGPLDLHARSDFGRVLTALAATRAALLSRQTLLLVLGDARNNRRPPRADLLRACRERVQRLVWLVPEPRARWNTGDSVLDRYAPLCDAVLECCNLGALLAALRRTL